MARYYGEVFRLNLGGQWRLSDRDPKLLHYGMPVIYGFLPTNPEFEFCPQQQFHVFTVTKKRGLLRGVLDLVFPPKLRPDTPPEN